MANELIFTILGIDKGSEAFDKVGKSADETKAKLDSFGHTANIVLAAMPAAALAGGVATAGALGIVSAGVIGLAAVAVHNNEEIITSFGTLSQSIVSSTKAAAAPLAGEFVLAANKMRQAVTDMQPEINQLFTGLGPDIQALTNGVVGFARNAMPGFVTAVQNSRAPVEGFSSLLKDTGTGISLFFSNISHGAESSGSIMSSLGRDIRDLLGFTGSLFAQLSNAGGPAVHALEGALRQAEGTILSLGQSAFPVLSNAASGFLSAGTGVLRLLQLVSPVIGPLIGQATSLAASLKLVDLVSFGGLTSSFGALKTAMGEAEGFGGKLKAGLSGLMGPFGLLGIAGVALSLVLQGLGKSEQDAAEAAALHDKITRDLAADLDKETGAVTAGTRAAIANSVAKDKVGKASSTLADYAGHLGIQTSAVTDAIINQNGELGSLDTSLRAHVQSQIKAKLTSQQLQQIQQETGKSLEDLTTIYMGGAGGVDAFQQQLISLEQTQGLGTEGLAALGDTMQGATLDARNLWGGVTIMNSGLTDAQKQALQAAAALGNMTQAQKDATATAAALKKDFATLADSMAKVSDKGTAVMDVLDRMSGKQPDLRITQQAWDDLMRSMNKDTDWDTAKDGIQKLSKGLVDARGEINTTTEAGSKLLGFAESSKEAFANQAAAMAAAHIPADQMTKKLNEMRQAFIDNAIAQGLPKDAAIRLADAYQLVPGSVVTTISAPGLLTRMQELGLLSQQILTLPDGTFEVIANTDPARGSITKLIQDTNGRTITLNIVATARGEIVRNMAGGLPAAAGGTDYAPGGLMLVGEKGPEVMEVPRGARIHDAVKTAHMLAPTGTPLSLSTPGSSESPQVVHKHYHLGPVYAGNTSVDLEAQFRRMELLAGV